MPCAISSVNVRKSLTLEGVCVTIHIADVDLNLPLVLLWDSQALRKTSSPLPSEAVILGRAAPTDSLNAISRVL